MKCKILGSMAGGIRGIIPDKLKDGSLELFAFLVSHTPFISLFLS